METEKKYEKTISLKRMLYSLKKNFLFIIIFIVLITGLSAVFFSKNKKYTVTAQLCNDTNITLTSLSTLKDAMNSSTIMERAAQKLEEKGIQHANGEFYTAKELSNNLVIPSTNNSLYIDISMVGNEKNNLDFVLNITLEEVTKYLNAESTLFSKLSISSPAKEIKDTTKMGNKLIFIALLSFLISYVAVIIIDIHIDTVENIEDVQEFSKNVYEIDL